MKQPDRFARLVNRAVGNPDAGPARMGITNVGAAKLLRAEHKAMVRLANKARRFTHNTDRGMELNKNGAWVFIDDLLAALAERAT